MNSMNSWFVKGVIGTDPILFEGRPQIAFVGRSNVGKSSLINSLVGKSALVKTGKKPGKTTEINIFSVNDSVYFVDLPGYGYAAGGGAQMEKIRKMILWYLSESGVVPSAVVLVVDSKVGCTDFDLDMLRVLREEGLHYILVANKTDKLTQKEVATQIALMKTQAREADVVAYSAVTHRQRDALLRRLLV